MKILSESPKQFLSKFLKMLPKSQICDGYSMKSIEGDMLDYLMMIKMKTKELYGNMKLSMLFWCILVPRSWILWKHPHILQKVKVKNKNICFLIIFIFTSLNNKMDNKMDNKIRLLKTKHGTRICLLNRDVKWTTFFRRLIAKQLYGIFKMVWLVTQSLTE